MKDAAEIVRDELLPRMEELCALARQQGLEPEEAFFRQIQRGLEQVREPDDLADPFMALSTSAFQGFRFGPDITLLLDDVLALAQSLSMTLTAPADAPN